MGILEGILYTLWRGLAIGIIISAPMGPVGILCVQRTLDKGRRTGLYTGVGAALSDLIYCLLTGFGLSFIEEFLEQNSNIIQLVGSIVLIGFGVYLFKSNPSRNLKKPSGHRIPAGKNILNGFLFTVSNPLIIFLIIGLFARFNFLLPEIKFYHYIIGYVSIFVGALGWWYFVTYFVDKVRAHFNLRSMWLVNKIIGSVIFLFAIVGIFTAVSGLASATRPAIYLNSRRGFGSFANAADSALVITSGPSGAVSDMIAVPKGEDVTWQFRVSARHAGAGWGIVAKGGGRTTVISFVSRDDRLDETYSSPHVEMCVKVGDRICGRKRLSSNFNLYSGENAFRFLADRTGWKLQGGNRTYGSLAEYSVDGFTVDSLGFEVYPRAEIAVDHMSVEVNGVGNILPEYVDVNGMRGRLRISSDPMEGEWAVFDRMLDESFLRLGGDYRLLIQKNGTAYDLIYLSGGQKNPANWISGMRKGRLVGSPFKNVYDVEWIGSSGEVITGAKAEYEDNLLRIMFPDMSSELRLGKIYSAD